MVEVVFLLRVILFGNFYLSINVFFIDFEELDSKFDWVFVLNYSSLLRKTLELKLDHELFLFDPDFLLEEIGFLRWIH
jgi:hypothetical protein